MFNLSAEVLIIPIVMFSAPLSGISLITGHYDCIFYFLTTVIYAIPAVIQILPLKKSDKDN